jgi:hypothetical protein
MLHFEGDEESAEIAQANGGTGGKASDNGTSYAGAAGTGGGYSVSGSGNFVVEYQGGSGVSGLNGGQLCKGGAGAYHSTLVSPVNFEVHNTPKVFGNNHSAGLTYYNKTEKDGGCGGDSLFSAGGPGCTVKLSYSGGYEYSYIPNYAKSSGYITEST